MKHREPTAIITWCDNEGKTNYGQLLQCYAMQRVCEMLGFPAFIVLYRQKTPKDFVRRKLPWGFMNQAYELLYKVKVVEKSFNRRIYRFRRFIARYIKHSRPCYHISEVGKLTKNCSYLICGSDQIWNPVCFDETYFLNFGTPNQKRIAYAPSGVFVENARFTEVYKKMGQLISGMDYVSVREEESRSILMKYTEKEIRAVLDPTLLLKQADWDLVAAGPQYKEPYILCYAVGNINCHKLLIKHVMKKHGVSRILYIPSNITADSFRQGIACKDAGPSEFISLIRDATAVCTDSFHGMAISIQYRKQFYLLPRIQRRGADWVSSVRMENILTKFHIGKRLIRCLRDLKELQDIDYDSIEEYIHGEREKSLQFLQEAFGRTND